MLRPVVLALTVVSGFTGLAYEVAWQKYLAILLGAHSEATASVLGLFLGGLSLGYWLFGALTRGLVARGRQSGRAAPLLVVYGAIEAGIGVWCLLFPWIFPLARAASGALPSGEGALGFAFDIALAAGLILPPATLMGGTIPILTQALARNLDDATRVHAQIYASNTIGAFAGTLATGFVLIHWLGLAGTLQAMGLVNVAVGATFVLLGAKRRELADLETGAAAPLSGGVFAVYGAVALLVGFAMMVLQTTVIRVSGFAFGSSEYTFTMVVAVFVLCIARGSFGVARRTEIGPRALAITLWVLALLCAVLYFLIESAPYWAHLLRAMFRDYGPAFYLYYLAIFCLILVVIGPAVVLSGAVLPLLFHALRREVGDLGSQAGRLYSVNTIGSLLGALLGGYLLLLWLDLHHIYRIAVAGLAVAASIVTLHQVPRIRFAGAALLVLGALLAIQQFPAWRTSVLLSGTFRQRQPTSWTLAGPSVLWTTGLQPQYVFTDDDPNSSVGVQQIEQRDGFTRSIVVNGKSDGNTEGDYPTMALAALLPALFAERAEHAFVIGFGTGITAGELAELAENQSVTVAEISSGVIDGAPLFDFANHGVSTHPKVRIIHSDAYRALRKGRRSYDVIVSEPSNPWVSGVEQLFSREFLAEARDRLNPRGVYCQWFHTYETSPEAIALVLRTYASVFDDVAVWSVNHADLLLLGFRDSSGAANPERIERRMQQPDFRAGFERVGIRDLPTLLAHETLPLGVLRAANLRGPVHTLYHPLLSFEAGRGFFVGTPSTLPFTGYGVAAEIGAANSLMRRYLANGVGKRVGIPFETLSHACGAGLPGCGALVAGWTPEEPLSGEAERLVAKLEQTKGSYFRQRLRSLIDGSVPKRRIRGERAIEVTQLYLQEYSHAVPFDVEALLGAWRQCGRNPSGVERCAPGLRVAERLALGDAPPADVAQWVNESAPQGSATRGVPREEQPVEAEDDEGS